MNLGISKYRWLDNVQSCCVSCSEPFVLQGDGDELLDGEDTMKDLRTTFAGIFGEKK